jgi:hypothetical protein
MPFLSDDLVAGGLSPQVPGDIPDLRPDFTRETLPAAFNLYNTVTSVANAAGSASVGERAVPDFDPFRSIQGYEDWADAFVDADTPEQVARIKAKIDRENRSRETLAAAGPEGFAAGLAAGLLDPVNLIPVGGTVYKSGRLGYSVAKSAGAGARAGLMTGAAQEAVLYGTQETRTAGESAVDVGVTTILAGALGGAAPLVRAGLGSARQSVAIARDRRALGELYSRAHADPEGVKIGTPGDRHVIDLGQVQQGLERVVVDRGEGVFRDNGSLKLDTNFGLVKVIWKHGAESPEASNPQLAHLVVGKADVLDLAAVVRRYDPEHITDLGKGRMEWRWAVEREAENGVRRQVVYAVRRFLHGDQADHVVTVYAPKPGSELPLSVPKGRAGAAAGSPSEGLRPVRDTAGEPSSQLSQGQRAAAPMDSIAPDAARAEHSPLDDLAGRAERDLAPPPEGALDPLEPGFVKVAEENPAAVPAEVGTVPGQGGSVGAKAVRDTTLAEETLKSALGLEKAVRLQDPVLRAVTSPSIETRRVIQDLAETPLYFEKNAAGVASPVAVTTRIKMWDAPLARSISGMDDLFIRYRLGRDRRMGDVQRVALGDTFRRREAGVLDYPSFRKAVGEALRRGDASDIPEVAEAARLMRREVFDPLKDKAIEAGLLPEGVKPETAASYLTRVYDVPRIVAKRPEFEGRLVTWLRDLRDKSGVRLREFEDATRKHESDVIQREAEHANTDGEYKANKAAWEAARFGVTAVERDLVAARRELREAVSAFDASAKRLEKFSVAEREAALAEVDAAAVDGGAPAPGAAPQRPATSSAKAKAREIAFNHRRIEARRGRAEERLAAAEASLSDLVKVRDAARLETYANSAKLVHVEGELRKARAALEKASKAFHNEKAFAGLEDIELRDVATQITDQVIGASPARSFYEPVPLTRGPLRERTLTISDYAIEAFLESDAEAVARIYTRTMAADVELATAFGRADLQDQLDKIASDYARLRVGVTDEGQLVKLDKRMRADLRDVAAVRDRIRGTFALPADPSGFIVRVGRVARNWNYLRLMGGMTLTSIPDAGRAVTVHGIERVVRDGLVPLVTNLRGFSLMAEEAKLAGTALDMVLDSRAMQLSEIWDDYGRLSKFERGLHALTNRYGVVSLMAPWNTAMKQFAAVVTQSRLLQISEAMANRVRSLNPKEAEYMAMLGIDGHMAERVAAQFGQHGELQAGGVRWANTAAWTDREAVDAFRAALVKDVDRIIATPGQDKPLWMSTELGKTIGQFKSFAFASTQRVTLAALQQRDAAALNGIMLSVGLGMLSYGASSAASGRETAADPLTWVGEGFDRSGVLFWMADVNNMGGKLFGLGGSSRYQSRSVSEALLGPTLGTGLDTTVRVVGSAGRGDWQASDTRALRRLVPWQNLFYLRRLFDQAEEGVNEALGVPGK